MKIVYDGDLSAPEIQISMTRAEIDDVGKKLISYEQKIIILSDGATDEFYPVTLKGLAFELVNELALQPGVGLGIEDEVLYCRGGKIALGKLGQSFLNYFAGPIIEGDHLHIDYYEGSELVAPTNIHLIVECLSQEGK